jgi:Domain of unknown function (DUF4249)
MKRMIHLALCLGLVGCERVVSIELAEGPKQLVVEARLERVRGAVSGAQVVRLSTTDSYFSNAAPPPARGATVRVLSDAGETVPFTESPTEAGVYRTESLTGVVGRRYTLQITYQGETYEATEPMMGVPPIDTVYFAPRNTAGPAAKGVRATIDFTDVAGVRNYYLWDQYVNGSRLIVPDSAFRVRVAAADDGLDGRDVREFQPYDGIEIPPGADVLIRQMALSETVYRYYRALSDQSSNDGSPFSVPLSSVRSNVANRTNASHRALGYFMATEVAEARARAP